MRETKNLRVVDTTTLLSPNEILRELPLSERAAERVLRLACALTRLAHVRLCLCRSAYLRVPHGTRRFGSRQQGIRFGSTRRGFLDADRPTRKSE